MKFNMLTVLMIHTIVMKRSRLFKMSILSLTHWNRSVIVWQTLNCYWYCLHAKQLRMNSDFWFLLFNSIFKLELNKIINKTKTIKSKIYHHTIHDFRLLTLCKIRKEIRIWLLLSLVILNVSLGIFVIVLILLS